MNMFASANNRIWPGAPCAEYEDQILEMQHGCLGAAARGRLTAHLSACPACRQFAADLKSLDDALEGAFGGKQLPASFKQALLSRIDAESASLAPERIAIRKESIDSDYRRQSADLLQGVAREHWSVLLDGLGLATMAILASLVLPHILIQGFNFGALLPNMLSSQNPLERAWVVAAVAVAAGLWIGLRGRNPGAGLFGLFRKSGRTG